MADENYSYAPKYVQIQNYILQKIESGESACDTRQYRTPFSVPLYLLLR